MTGYTVGAAGTILKTTNGGTNWVFLNTGYTNRLKSVYFLNVDTGYVVVNNTEVYSINAILKTTNGGINWSIYSNFESVLNDIFFTNNNSGYAVGYNGSSRGVIFNTTNAGANWNTQFLSTTAQFTSVYFVNEYTGFAGGRSNGSLYKTYNAGLNWIAISTVGAFNYFSIKLVNDSIGYVSCNDGKIQKTTNYGLNWSTISVLGLPHPLFSTYFISSDIGYVAGGSGTLVKTTNGGLNWEMQLSNTAQTLNSVFFPDKNTGYAVGNEGVIIKTINGNVYTKVSLKILMEGLYNSNFNQLLRKDSIQLYLRKNIPPFELQDSISNTIDTLTHSNTFIFSNSPTGSYYIVAKHINCIETWSKSGGEYLLNNNSIYNYDFTTSYSQAYGNNLKLKGSKYCIYSGDVNQDGFINLTDIVEIYNNSTIFTTGNYLPTDLNGDSIVDLNDVALSYNNSVGFVNVIKP